MAGAWTRKTRVVVLGEMVRQMRASAVLGCFGFGWSFASDWGEEQAGVGRQLWGFEAVETHAAASQAADTGDEVAVAVAAEAVYLTAGGGRSTAQPRAGGKYRAADGLADEGVPSSVVGDEADFKGVGHRRFRGWDSVCKVNWGRKGDCAIQLDIPSGTPYIEPFIAIER